MQKHLTAQIAMLLFVFILFASCGTTKQVVVTKQTYTFDYVPKQTNSSGSSNMVLALIKPSYASTFTSGRSELFRSFQTALGSDLEELIIGKGFTMKGPYIAFDEMVFEDKKRTDVAIVIDIAPAFTAAEGGWKMNVSLLGTAYNTYTYSGTVSLVGKINLTGIEPLTNEKIWSKSVLIPNVENISIETSQKYSTKLGNAALLDDPSVYNALGKALREQYEGILAKIEAHFSPEEFNSLKAQVKELKSKKGF